MKLKWILVWLIFLSIGCASELDFPFTENEKKIVTYSVFSPDSLFKVVVRKTYNILQPNITKYGAINFKYSDLEDLERPFYDTISNANVEIWNENVLLENLTKSSARVFRSKKIRTKAGISYTLKVSVVGFPTVSSSTTIPEKILIQKFVRDGIIVLPNKKIKSTSLVHFPFQPILTGSIKSTRVSNYDTQYRVIFKDPGETENYYRLWLRKLNEIFPIINGTSNELSDHMESVIFTDKLFNGSICSIKVLGCSDYLNKTDTIICELQNLSRELYDFYYQQYFNTSKEASDSRLNSETGFVPYVAEPEIAYTNINNGFGIFAAYNTHRDTLFYKADK